MEDFYDEELEQLGDVSEPTQQDMDAMFEQYMQEFDDAELPGYDPEEEERLLKQIEREEKELIRR